MKVLQMHSVVADNLDDGQVTYWDTDQENAWEWVADQAEHRPDIIFFFVLAEETTDIWDEPKFQPVKEKA